MAEDPSPSLFDRTIAHRRSIWATLGLVLLIYLPTLAAAYELGLTDFFTNPGSRGILSGPTIIAYIVVLGPILAGQDRIVVRSLRPIILLDDEELAGVVRRASAISPIHEAAAIATGLFFGFLIIGGVPAPGESWPTYVWVGTGYVMLGLLGWIGFMSIAGTRVISQLLRQPMRVDPLDITPFEAIGRQSLVLALVFVGGITLGLLLGNYGMAALSNPRFWLLFLPLSLVPVVVFFLNMRPTQRVLAASRNRALAEVREQLRRAFHLLLERMQNGEATGNVPWEVNALVAYEKELLEASTWPYNTAILRTLVVSVLVPTLMVFARRIFEVYIR